MTSKLINPLAFLYNTTDTSSWPTLSRQQLIPAQVAAKHASPHRPSKVGPGIIKGICTVLTTDRVISLAQDADRWSLRLTSSTGGADHVLGGTVSAWYIEYRSYLAAVVALTDALTVDRLHPRTQDVLARYTDFLVRLYALLGTSPPYTADQLARQAAYDVGATETLMGLSDELWFWSKARIHDLTTVYEQPDPHPVPLVVNSCEHVYYLRPMPAPTGTAASCPAPQTPLRVLTRLIERGGTALLFGPTGVGKSELARAAAREQGVRLIKVEGRPGLDDKQLFGGTRPVPGGFQWVDGPLSKAWRLAAQGERVALIVDELARFDPWHLAAFIGALDPVRAGDLALMDAIPAEALAQAHHQPAWRYYVLTLPTGDVCVAPANRLSVIATTNLGADYLQVQQAFDAALLRRFALHLEIARLDAATRQRLVQELGLPAKIARLMVAIEDHTTTATDQAGGLLRRELNLGVVLNWATEVLAQVNDGVPLGAAVRSAATMTVIPFVCDRDDFGRIEHAAAEGLRQQIDKLLVSCGV